MADHSDHLDIARRHVVEADARILRQRLLLGEMRASGQPTELARQLLASMVETARQMRAHLVFLEREDRGA